MRGVRHLSIEIGPRCNLSAQHEMCPAHNRVIDGTILPVDRIIDTVQTALDLGFEGFVGFHFYNEPTLYAERMSAVMDALPGARFMLWTNNPDFTDPRFSWVVRSDYSDPAYQFDARLDNYTGKHTAGPCWRPMLECAIDYTGRVALCCQDWKMHASGGSVALDSPADVLTEWYAQAMRCSVGMTPRVCDTCRGRQSKDTYTYALRQVGM